MNAFAIVAGAATAQEAANAAATTSEPDYLVGILGMVSIALLIVGMVRPQVFRGGRWRAAGIAFVPFVISLALVEVPEKSKDGSTSSAATSTRVADAAPDVRNVAAGDAERAVVAQQPPPVVPVAAPGRVQSAPAPQAVQAASSVTVDNQTSMSGADIDRAFDIFKRNCSPLDRYWSDIQTVRITVRTEYGADHRLAKGWKTAIHLAIVVPQNPRLIPAANNRVGVIAGHTLHYHLGGGSEPGMMGTKRVSQFLCGMPIADNGHDTFKAVPELAFLRY